MNDVLSVVVAPGRYVVVNGVIGREIAAANTVVRDLDRADALRLIAAGHARIATEADLG